MPLRSDDVLRAVRARRVGAFERRLHALALIATRMRADAQRLPHLVADNAAVSTRAATGRTPADS